MTDNETLAAALRKLAAWYRAQIRSGNCTDDLVQEFTERSVTLDQSADALPAAPPANNATLAAECQRASEDPGLTIGQAWELLARAADALATPRINSTVPCHRGAKCGWPGCPADCDGRPGLSATSGASAWRPTHQHRKGEKVEFVGRGFTQSDYDMHDMTKVVVYRTKDRMLWARQSFEWSERFTTLPASPQTSTGK